MKKTAVILSICVALVFIIRCFPLFGVISEGNLRVSKALAGVELANGREWELVSCHAGLANFWERPFLLVRQLVFQRRIIFKGHFFEPDEVSLDEKIQSVGRILIKNESVEPWTNNKLCGGFHGDYLLQWQSGNETIFAILCLSCDEVLYYKGCDSFRMDLTSKSAQLIEGVMSKDSAAKRK